MNILYIAYSCKPNKGSEEKIGWNVPLESAKTNQVIVVTKEEHREVIEQYVAEHKIENPKFYFVDIPSIYKKVLKGSAYSARLNIWHKRAFPVVKEICNNEKVDIIHQITPIEFRSIGAYYKISNTRFVCGPLGGGENIPRGLKGYALRNIHVEAAHSALNFIYKLKYKITKQLSGCDYFLFANRETQFCLKNLIGNTANELYFDNGVSDEDLSDIKQKERSLSGKTVFLVAGRMAYRKGHRFLLDVIKQLPKDINCEFRFVGDGPECKRLKRICEKYKLNGRVVFTGRITFEEMAEEYCKADVFIMPSIRETTGAVLMEAAANFVPVIAINRFGASVLYDNDSAYLYEGENKSGYINALKNVVLKCVGSSDEICAKAQNARKIVESHTWQNKVRKYNVIYNRLG